MGSGTHGSGGSSDQTRLGITGFVSVLTHGYSQGLTFFETADQYGAHPHMKEAIRQVGRQNVVVLTKTDGADRRRRRRPISIASARELGIDMIDIVLLHNKTERDLDDRVRGRDGDAVARQGERRHPRARRVVPQLEALRLAAATPLGRRRSRAHEPRRPPDGRRPGPTVIACCGR